VGLVRDAYADIGNTYQAVLMQDAGWRTHGSASSQLSDPLTQAAAEPQGGWFKGDMSADRGFGWGSKTDVQTTFEQNKDDKSPDSGFEPGKG
jgi:hypothetical protein